MKYFLLAASLIVFGTASAQTGSGRPTALQNDSAMTVGRGLISAKLTDLKTANTNNDTALFRSYANQYYALMRTGMFQSGRKIDLGPKTAQAAGVKHFADIEYNTYDFKNLLKASVLNRAELVKKAEEFKALY